jgi:hypothetical protein
VALRFTQPTILLHLLGGAALHPTYNITSLVGLRCASPNLQDFLLFVGLRCASPNLQDFLLKIVNY